MEQKKIYLKPEISLGFKQWAVLKKEFNVSRQTISDALKYSNNSDTAKIIRERAKQLLQNDIDIINQMKNNAGQ